MSPEERKIAEMLAIFLEEITMDGGRVLSSSVKIIEKKERGYKIVWEGIIYIGFGEEEVIDGSDIDLGITHICHETFIGEIVWESEPAFEELGENFLQSLFEQNWSYTSIGITDARMSPEMIKIVLDVIGTESIGSALVVSYGTESSVLFQKYPEPLAALLKECLEDAISEMNE